MISPLGIAIDFSSGLPLVVCAGVAMYVASKALAEAFAGGHPGRAGWLAFGQWLPIAIVSVAAAAMNRGPLAMGLIFSTAVACLSLSIGAVAFLGVGEIASTSRRSWAMLVPAGLLVFLAGFRASISLFNAGVLALQGICVLLLWNDRSIESAAKISPVDRGMFFRVLEAMLGLMVAAVGAWLGIHGMDAVAKGTEFASTGLLAATMLSPLLVLPIIGTGTELAQRGQSGTAITSSVGVALLNTCALLPMVVLAGAIRQMVTARSVSFDKLVGFPFPLAVWRVDVVVLIALGLFLLPVAIGRWSISKLQGAGLMLGYILYLMLAIVIGILRV